MITSEKSATPVKSTIDNKKEFHVNESSLMFEVVSVGLYTHGVAAVVRELCCNAYDSHKEAGKLDIPFNVTFPTYKDRVFIVEDFGVGMTREGVENNICGIFNSTKNQTDELIGGLGLGSKTPFIISDTFTIRARKDGEENTFVAYLTEDRKPHVSLIGSRQMSEPNGVRIEVPVSGDHFVEDFETEARAIFSFLRPNVEVFNHCADEFTLAFPNIMDELEASPIVFSTFGNTNSKLYRPIKATAGYREGPNLTVVMGGVAYPMGLMKDLIKDKDLYGKMVVIGNEEPVIVKAEIGEMRVNPSRETLRRDTANIKALMGKIEPFVKSTEEEIRRIVEESDFARDVIIKMAERFCFSRSVYEINNENHKMVISLLSKFDVSNKFVYEQPVRLSEMSCFSEVSEFGYTRKTRVRADGAKHNEYITDHAFRLRSLRPDFEVVLLKSTEGSRGRTPVYEKLGGIARLVFVVQDDVPVPEALAYYTQYGAKITWLDLDEEYNTIKRERAAEAKKIRDASKDSKEDHFCIEGWHPRYEPNMFRKYYYGVGISSFGQILHDGSAVGQHGVLNPPKSRPTFYVCKVADRFYLEEGGKELDSMRIGSMTTYISHLMKDDPYILIKTRTNAKYFNECGIESLADAIRRHIKNPDRNAIDLMDGFKAQDIHNLAVIFHRFADVIGHPKAKRLCKVFDYTNEKIKRQKAGIKLHAIACDAIGLGAPEAPNKTPTMVSYRRRFKEVLMFRKALKEDKWLNDLMNGIQGDGGTKDILTRSFIFTHHRKVWNKMVHLMGLTKEQAMPKFD